MRHFSESLNGLVVERHQSDGVGIEHRAEGFARRHQRREWDLDLHEHMRLGVAALRSLGRTRAEYRKKKRRIIKGNGNSF
jgi:hypothetical protein